MMELFDMDIEQIKKFAKIENEKMANEGITRVTDFWKNGITDIIEDMLASYYFLEVQSKRRDITTNDIEQVVGANADVITKTVDRLKNLFKARERGFILMGTPGTGKTTMLKAIEKIWQFAMRRTITITRHLTIQSLTAYEASKKIKDNGTEWLTRTDAIIIDDIGTEPKEVNDFGTVSRPINTIIENIYDKEKYFFASTNMSPKQFVETYGERITDRMKEAYRSIIIDVKSFRG